MSDLKKFGKLSRDEQNAFLGFFAGGRSNLKVFEGREEQVFMGKYECERVPFTFWTEKLPKMGWITVETGEKRPALGMADLPGGRKPWCWDVNLSVTERGWNVREDYWSDFDRRIKERKA